MFMTNRKGEEEKESYNQMDDILARSSNSPEVKANEGNLLDMDTDASGKDKRANLLEDITSLLPPSLAAGAEV